MFSNTLFVCVIVLFLYDFSRGQSDEDLIENDYIFIEALNSFYKIHTIAQNWSNAKQLCVLEGASLFYPENDDEQNAVMSFRNTTQPDVKWVFVGISDLTTEGEFETIDGKPLSEVYSKWKPNEPNDLNGGEDCVEQDNTGKMNDVECSEKFPFICKKRLPTPERNYSCNTDGQRDKEVFRSDYTYIEAVNSVYKIHTTPQTWSAANLQCALEEASLFYPENDDEQNAVMLFRNTTQPDVKWVFLGISDLTTEGVFETIDGKALSQVYSNWKSNEPNDVNGEEDCVEQDNTGKMNDVKCSQKFSFICKKSLSTPERNNSCNKNGQKDKEFMRKDFIYIEAVNSFYKIHTTPQNWSDAKLECALEGASLFYPENEDEQNAVITFRNTTQPDVKWVFVGISDLTTEGVFETIDGKPLSQVYSSWKSNEPNDVNGEEDCVEQDNAGKMNDVKCSQKFSFICKKSLSTPERNNSCNKGGKKDKEFVRKDYIYIEAVNSFYKIHTTPQNWSDAKLECALEGASLFYPENEDEHNAVISFRNTTQPDVKWVFVGISDLTTEGVFETIDGKPLSQVYSSWKSNEPNDVNGEEDCVEQDNTGKMNDVKCSQKFSFICKKSLSAPERNNSCNKGGKKDKEFVRKDYIYIEAVNSFYKIHTTPQNWSDAKLECALEGASLFYPENEDEQNAVISLRNTTQPDVKWVFVGISDLTTEGVFETIDGKPLSQVYSSWKSNEPNDVNGEEDCVEQDNAGKMNDVKCSQKFSFICKKSLSTPERNNSCNKGGKKDKEFVRKDYIYIEAVNSFYKIHTTPQNWSDAKLECALEGTSLFYPENEDEQNAVMSFRNTTQPDVKWVFVGISDLTTEGVFETIDGKTLSEVYSNWKSNEPNDVNGEEDCVEQDNAGKMNDVKCSQKFSFICKKKLPSPERNNNSSNIDEQRGQQVIQKEYTYIEAVNSIYKIHTTPQNWSDAKLQCALEGASLFYPENDNEQIAVMSFRNATHPDVKSVFLGISDLMTEGVFETIDGKSISDVYNNWKPGEPNDDNGEEDCVEQNNTGEMSDRKCSEKLSFICKKSLLPTERNNSTDIDGQKYKQLIRKDYTYIEAVNSFYKIHTTPQNWSNAKLECAQEGASLFYSENYDEQDAVMSVLNTTKPDVKRVFVGISDLETEGVFETIDGKSVSDVYNNWKLGEPNDDNGEEDCVEQDNTGVMSDRKCSEKLSFICKKRLLPLARNNNSNMDGQKDKEFFRIDYTYIESENSFYKIHTTPQTWSNAKLQCALEGASLFYSANDDEQNAVMSFRNTTKPEIKRVFVGISDLTSEGVFETIDGRTVSDVYNEWRPGEDCVEQDNTGEMNKCKCSEKLSFICKKSLPAVQRNNSCNVDYSFDNNSFKCYKLHSTPLTWAEAYVVCRAEQAHLAVINNRLEADYLANLTESSSNGRIGGNHQLYRGIYHLGFHYRFKEGWQTVRGTPFIVGDDAWWNNNQPIIDENEQCGSMFYTGRLHSVDCGTKSFFICEQELDSSYLSEEMYQ